MATLAENAAAVKAAQVAIDAAIVAKGGTTTGGLTNAAAAIAAIPAGSTDWQPPSDWPDIRDVLKADTHNFAYKCAVLFDNFTEQATIDLSGADAYVTSDGSYITETATHEWDRSKDIDGKYRWVLYLKNTDDISLSVGITNASWIDWVYAPDCDLKCPGGTANGCFKNAVRIKSITAKKISGAVNNCYGQYSNAKSLENIEAETIQICSGNTGYIFQYVCLSRIKAKIVFSNSIASYYDQNFSNSMIQSVDGIDYGFVPRPNILSGRLTCLPDEIIAMHLTTVGAFDGSLTDVLGTPVKLTCNMSFSLTKTTYNKGYRYRFADFDASGNLVGGMAYNMNEVSGLTATISATIKGFFTATEQDAIEAAFNAKGWTLAW